MQLHSDGSLDGSQAEPKDEPLESFQRAFDHETQSGPLNGTGKCDVGRLTIPLHHNSYHHQLQNVFAVSFANQVSTSIRLHDVAAKCLAETFLYCTSLWIADAGTLRHINSDRSTPAATGLPHYQGLC